MTSADWRNKIGTDVVSFETAQWLYDRFDWVKDSPQWLDNLDFHEASASALTNQLRTLNAVLARLRQVGMEPPPRLLLYGMKVSSHARTPAAAKVYLDMLLTVADGQHLFRKQWLHLTQQIWEGLERNQCQTPESWCDPRSKQGWVEVITGLDIKDQTHSARLRNPSLYTLFYKGCSMSWMAYVKFVSRFENADLLYREWVGFAQMELSSHVDSKETSSSSGSQVRAPQESDLEQFTTSNVTKDPSARSSVDHYNQLEEYDTSLFRPSHETEDPSVETRKRHLLTNELMNYVFGHLVSMGDFDRAWHIAHETHSMFGAVKASLWAQLLVKTDFFKTWIPKTHHSMMELLGEVEQKGWDRPVPQELIAATEQLEADLGIEWMGANDGHRMSGEQIMGHVPGIEDQKDESLVEDEDKANEQLEKANHVKDRDRIRRRAARKQRLASELSKVENVLRALAVRNLQTAEKRQIPSYAAT